jgi:hypothetical protein
VDLDGHLVVKACAVFGCRLHVALGEQFVDQIDVVAAGILELAPDAMESSPPSRIPPSEGILLRSSGTHDQTVAPWRVTVREVSGPRDTGRASLRARCADVTPAAADLDGAANLSPRIRLTVMHQV